MGRPHHQSARSRDHGVDMITTTSRARSPFASNSVFPSRVHEKSTIRPAVKLVNCRGSPPVNISSHTLVAPFLVSKYSTPLPVGAHRKPSVSPGSAKSCLGAPPRAGTTAILVIFVDVPSVYT